MSVLLVLLFVSILKVNFKLYFKVLGYLKKNLQGEEVNNLFQEELISLANICPFVRVYKSVVQL